MYVRNFRKNIRGPKRFSLCLRKSSELWFEKVDFYFWFLWFTAHCRCIVFILYTNNSRSNANRKISTLRYEFKDFKTEMNKKMCISSGISHLSLFEWEREHLHLPEATQWIGKRFKAFRGFFVSGYISSGKSFVKFSTKYILQYIFIQHWIGTANNTLRVSLLY